MARRIPVQDWVNEPTVAFKLLYIKAQHKDSHSNWPESWRHISLELILLQARHQPDDGLAGYWFSGKSLASQHSLTHSRTRSLARSPHWFNRLRFPLRISSAYCVDYIYQCADRRHIPRDIGFLNYRVEAYIIKAACSPYAAKRRLCTLLYLPFLDEWEALQLRATLHSNCKVWNVKNSWMILDIVRV